MLTVSETMKITSPIFLFYKTATEDNDFTINPAAYYRNLKHIPQNLWHKVHLG